MCAIWGFISQRGRGPRIETLEAIAEANELRGPHAFGFAWIDGRGILRQYKQTGRASDHLALLSMLHDARMIVGHLRYATHGSAADQINNHPHPADGGWIVHNGIIRNYEALLAMHEFCQVSECDSEVLALLIEDRRGSLLARSKQAINRAAGSLAMLGLWRTPNTLIAARRGNPLHLSTTSDGIYLATMPDELPGQVTAMRDRSAVAFTINRGKILSEVSELRADRESDFFTRSGPYRGG